MICESHPFRIYFDGLSGDEHSYEIARIHFINVKAIRHVVKHAKSLFSVNTGITTVSSVMVVNPESECYSHLWAKLVSWYPITVSAIILMPEWTISLIQAEKGKLDLQPTIVKAKNA